jgi:hypothetical protein
MMNRKLDILEIGISGTELDGWDEEIGLEKVRALCL